MNVIPGGIWFMWALNFGLSIMAVIVAVVINKKEGGEIKW